jgi:uncharacterized iron-regulated protein
MLGTGCAVVGPAEPSKAAASGAVRVMTAQELGKQLDGWLARKPAPQAILLGEQHDNPDHQRIERDTVLALAARGRLAALVVEMAEQGRSTAGLMPQATEEQVREALGWSPGQNEGW